MKERQMKMTGSDVGGDARLAPNQMTHTGNTFLTTFKHHNHPSHGSSITTINTTTIISTTPFPYLKASLLFLLFPFTI